MPNAKDERQAERLGNRFQGFRMQEVNGYLYRLGFSTNGAGLCHKKGSDGQHVLVVEAGKLFLHTGTGKRTNCLLSDSSWDTIKGAYQRGWKIFFIVWIGRRNCKDFNAKRSRKKRLVYVSKPTKADHVVALEVCHNAEQQSTRWHLHNSELITGAKKPRRSQRVLNIFRTYTHKYIQKMLGINISLQYAKIDYTGIPNGCSLYVIWIIQESLKGRVIPSLTSNPNLTRLFLQKCNLVRYPDDDDLLKWKWEKLEWKFESILDALAQDETITWEEVVKMKAKVLQRDRKASNSRSTNDTEDDEHTFAVRRWKPSF